MNFKVIATALAAFLLIGPATQADDFADVKSVIQKYFDGTEQGKLDVLREAFMPSAEIQYVLPDGTLGRLPFPEYVSRFTPGAKAARKGRVMSVDVTGTAASVKVEVFMSERRRVYTDYILLLKLEDGWRISNKVATFRETY